MDLSTRLAGIAKILEESHREILLSPIVDTGFVPTHPNHLIKIVTKVLEIADKKSVSLDLGCGNGGWTLIAAAAGFSSHGIEISPLLLDHAQRNYERALAKGYIDEATPCKFILGDMIPTKYSSAYDTYRKTHDKHLENMPIGPLIMDIYEKLPISIASADIIYCWAWPTQSRFLFNMLESEAREDAIFILPSYIRYTQGEFLSMHPLKNTLVLRPILSEGEAFIGVRER